MEPIGNRTIHGHGRASLLATVKPLDSGKVATTSCLLHERQYVQCPFSAGFSTGCNMMLCGNLRSDVADKLQQPQISFLRCKHERIVHPGHASRFAYPLELVGDPSDHICIVIQWPCSTDIVE